MNNEVFFLFAKTKVMRTAVNLSLRACLPNQNEYNRRKIEVFVYVAYIQNEKKMRHKIVNVGISTDMKTKDTNTQ